MFRTDFFLIVLKKYEETNRSRTSLLSYKRDSAIKKEMNTPAQRFAHGLKIFAMLAITQTGFWFTPIASGNGLGNTTKGFTPTREMHPADWSNPEELDRTWKSALFRIPDGNEVIAGTVTDLSSVELSSGQKRLPTIIYLHGCSGIWSGTYTRMDVFAQSGFAVIAPASFARKKYPKSCDPVKKIGGLYRAVLKMRQLDALHAIREARKLSWVDPDNIFLMGFSEGGIVSATLSIESGQSVRARVIEGWTCRAGWPEYRGLNRAAGEPILTLVAAGDPWFQNYWTKGNCTKFINTENGSRSVVYDTGPLQYKHSLLDSRGVQHLVIEFLRTHIVQ